MTFNNYLADSLSVIEKTSVSITQNQLDDVINVIVNSFKLNSSLLICGNGGSAADAMHIAGELVARFLIERKALKVISLVDNQTRLLDQTGSEQILSSSDLGHSPKERCTLKCESHYR